MNNEDLNRKVVALGEEARRFKTSALWHYVVDRSEEARDKAFNELLSVDPTDTKAIRELQESVKRFNTFSNWLDELVMAGETAYEEYLTREE